MPCPACGCDAATGTRAHALQAALRCDDIDAAIALGLLDANIDCVDCAAHCRDALRAARDERLRALAARERFRTRAARLARRQHERVERRKPIAPDPGDDAMPARASSLPPAAADALARAKAKAAGRRGQ
jgi:Na+-translocating ferredoxin:NAD+ oxidoreductase RnfC subunit